MLMQDHCAGLARWLSERLGAIFVLTAGLSRREYIKAVWDARGGEAKP